MAGDSAKGIRRERISRWTLVAAVALVVAVLALSGCGYSTQSSLDPQYRTIFVTAFRNQSREYDLQAPLTNAVRRKFLMDGRLRLVDQRDADLLLEGTITDYRLKGLIFDRDDETTQLRCVIECDVRLVDLKSGQVLWEEESLPGESTFYTRASGQSSDRLRGNAEIFLPTVTAFASEEENRAASEVLEQLASNVFFRTIEPW